MRRRDALLALSVILFSGAVVAATAEAQLRLRIGHQGSLENPSGLGSKRMAETADRLSSGKLKIDIFPNAQLGPDLDMLSQVRVGTLDMAMIGSGVVGSIEPTFNLTELPFIWKNDTSAWQVLNGSVGQRILGLLEAKGIKGLGWGVWGFRGFLLTNKAITTPDDFKGVKIRVIESALYISTLKSFGANPVPMAWPEVYTGLQQKTIDGVETNYHGMADAKHYEVAKQLAVTDHIYTATVFVMNLNKFRSLPPDLQKVVVAAARAGGERMRETANKANHDAIELMIRHGVKVTRPDRQAFEAKIKPVYKQFAVMVGQDLIDEALAAQK